jgi:hypothetical protein
MCFITAAARICYAAIFSCCITFWPCSRQNLSIPCYFPHGPPTSDLTQKCCCLTQLQKPQKHIPSSLLYSSQPLQDCKLPCHPQGRSRRHVQYLSHLFSCAGTEIGLAILSGCHTNTGTAAVSGTFQSGGLRNATDARHGHIASVAGSQPTDVLRI